MFHRSNFALETLVVQSIRGARFGSVNASARVLIEVAQGLGINELCDVLYRAKHFNLWPEVLTIAAELSRGHLAETLHTFVRNESFKKCANVWEAASRGHLDDMKLFLEQGINTNEVDARTGLFPLWMTA